MCYNKVKVRQGQSGGWNLSLLSNNIEQFILSLMSRDDSHVDLQRNELAQYFNCAPSQINYVLATRFTVRRGYVIESRRGGGGYIRIFKIPVAMASLSDYVEAIGDSIDEDKARSFCEYLYGESLITKRESALIAAAVSNKALAPFPAKDSLRAGIFRTILTQLLIDNEGRNGL